MNARFKIGTPCFMAHKFLADPKKRKYNGKRNVKLDTLSTGEGDPIDMWPYIVLIQATSGVVMVHI